MATKTLFICDLCGEDCDGLLEVTFAGSHSIGFKVSSPAVCSQAGGRPIDNVEITGFRQTVVRFEVCAGCATTKPLLSSADPRPDESVLKPRKSGD